MVLVALMVVRGYFGLESRGKGVLRLLDLVGRFVPMGRWIGVSDLW